ncbi:MAG: 3'(2'),5'-bisphosphate nucleotidase [Bacteroidetes bacterium 4572_114]|nr:MAG: 3'(2'),5'-bisphosphate nucleotidase [Bacteroidetes bacterium 4572_114]
MTNHPLQKIDFDQLLKLCIRAAFDAGNEILHFYNTGFDIETKSDNSPLTNADKAAHNVIAKALEKTNIPVLSEEGDILPYEIRKDFEYLWIVDPLDGTKEFIKHNDEFTVNIALVHYQKPILGVVYCPPLKSMYFAANNGKGAFKSILENYDKIDVENVISHAEKIPFANRDRKFTVVASRSHMNSETAGFIENLKKEHGDIELISKGSSLKLCEIAEGSADIYPRFAPTSEWDTAASHALVEISGGKVVDAKTNLPLQYNKEDILNPWFIVGRR